MSEPDRRAGIVGATPDIMQTPPMYANSIIDDISIKNLSQAAHDYAESGLSVFPVHYVDDTGRCSCGGKDGCTPGKHPMTAHGHNDATPDPRKVREWWKEHPNANIGVNCKASGIVVIDTDPRNDGHLTLAALEEEHSPMPETLTALTSYQNGTRGRHYYYGAPAGSVKLKGTMGTGIDVKYSGYVIMPPSKHPSGTCYEWVNPATPIADLPEWAYDLIIDTSATRPKRRLSSNDVGTISDQYGLKVEDYLWPVNARKIGPGEYRGEHPTHGSTGGQNLCVNTDTNTWFCFRHRTGGGPVEAMAVARGIIRCEDARPGCIEGYWYEIFSELEKDGKKPKFENVCDKMATEILKTWRRMQACRC